MSLLKEFKPALVFLARFVGLYLAGNILYGFYVESFKPAADDITMGVACQTSWLLDRAGYETAIERVSGVPKLALSQAHDVVLYVFEGCNGVNVMIVFVAFIFAFGGSLKRLAIFLPLGILVIHLFNLLRVWLLFNLALRSSAQFYYYHKYLFTATLYFIVFGLWALWVMKFNEDRSTKVPA